MSTVYLSGGPTRSRFRVDGISATKAEAKRFLKKIGWTVVESRAMYIALPPGVNRASASALKRNPGATVVDFEALPMYSQVVWKYKRATSARPLSSPKKMKAMEKLWKKSSRGVVSSRRTTTKRRRGGAGDPSGVAARSDALRLVMA
jgi:hypothetical protein